MKKSVLIVEDSVSNLQLLCDLVERVFDCIVAPAQTGEEAVELARQNAPDLVLMDLKLPGIDGNEAMERIRQDPNTAKTPVLALTGYIAGDDESRMREMGFDGYLPKPFDVPKLLEVVSVYLPQRKDL